MISYSRPYLRMAYIVATFTFKEKSDSRCCRLQYTVRIDDPAPPLDTVFGLQLASTL